MATVLNENLTNQTTGYSSGPLNVSTYKELMINFSVSNLSTVNGVPVVMSRIGADGQLYNLNTIYIVSSGKISMDIGAGLTINNSFGDSIQIDMTVFDGDSISTTIAITGK